VVPDNPAQKGSVFIFEQRVCKGELSRTASATSLADRKIRFSAKLVGEGKES
jgi:hypothetical protein